jgi:hypothetical protein
MIVMMILLRMMIFFLKNINNLDDEAKIKSFFLSSLESHIHDSSSKKEIIERLGNKI